MLRASASSTSACTHDNGPASYVEVSALSAVAPTSIEFIITFARSQGTGRPRESGPETDGGLHLEAGHRAPEVGCELRQLADGDVGLLRTFGGLFRDAQNALHAARDIADRGGLFLRLVRDARD